MIKFTDGIESNVSEKINTTAIKFMTNKGIYILAILSAFLVLSGASEKWTGYGG